MQQINLLILLLFALPAAAQPLTPQKQPNIVYILADDLGYNDLGCYGQKVIETPNIDALAKKGKLFTQHYTAAPVCAPSRCMLLTGQHSGNAYVRGNDEWKERGDVWNYQAMFDNPRLEGQRPLPDSILTIAEVLQQQGYRTGIFGKWGLGAPESEGTPNKQGFDTFYGYNCQRQAHTYYPMHLWSNDKRVLLNNNNVPPHANLADDANPDDAKSYSDFSLQDYAPTLIHNEALAFIEDNSKQPFFLYYASPIPHVALQAPKKWVNYYREKIGSEKPYTGTGYFPNQYPKATYAAMISYLDEQVGDLVQKLKDEGVYEKTLIIFTSDNGPSDAGGAPTPFFDSASPFVTEFGRMKAFVYEGGIRIPMIASWEGKINAGTTSDHQSSFYDFFATVCDLLKIDSPVTTDGISFLPELLDKKQRKHEFLYWEFPEHNGQQAVRKGKWKAIRQNLKSGVIKTELYDLSIDISEQKDIAAQYPKVVQELENIMAAEHTVSPVERFQMEAIDN
ncbi:MAG: arylsulfatase A-like enzyme [Spirosomataceae bacterium]|jgi:arylsulfatase